MGDLYMSHEMGEKLVKLIIGGLLLILAVIALVFAQSYLGRHNLEEAEEKARVALVDSQRGGCERAKLDRRANAMGWRTAQSARMNSVSESLDISIFEVRKLLAEEPKPDDPFDLVAARKYDFIATELEARSMIDCSVAFPKESAT